MTTEQLQSNVVKANMVIEKIQAKLGKSEGYASQLEVEIELLRQYIANNEKEEVEEDKEE